MYVLETQKSINYLVYIGDRKKMITVEFVSTIVHVHVYLHGKILNIQDQRKQDQINPCNPMPAATFVI